LSQDCQMRHKWCFGCTFEVPVWLLWFFGVFDGFLHWVSTRKRYKFVTKLSPKVTAFSS
jgi:hypothetical protein